ncbi:MAG TPA: hypothetical protein VL132_01025, partial [Planctomycetaceae bacterium]|nr:hypothetical protein [Planctomycetaceae bacterium]
KTLSGHKDDIYKVEYNPAGTRLLSVGYAGNLLVWDPAQDQPLYASKVAPVVYSATWSPNGEQIAVMANDGKVYLVEVPAAAR